MSVPNKWQDVPDLVSQFEQIVDELEKQFRELKARGDSEELAVVQYQLKEVLHEYTRFLEWSLKP